MRRAASLLVAALVAGVAVGASAAGSANYLDTFESGSWSGSDGSVAWGPDWSEIGDDGDPGTGNVSVVNNVNCSSGKCAQLGSLLAEVGMQRAADTSIFGGDLELRFTFKGTGLAQGTLTAYVSDGSIWLPVWSHVFVASYSEAVTVDLDDGYLSSSFGVRFTYVGTGVGGNVYIDDVEVRGALPEPTTTTTSTTTTTTAPTTTTTAPVTTTTTRPASTSSSTTTTTRPDLAGSDDAEGPSSTSSSTSTPGTTSSTREEDGAAVALSGPDGPPGGGGIRTATRGVQADFSSGLFGDVAALTPTVASFEAGVDFSMAVEVIEAGWAWLTGLGLVLAWSAVTGLDRRQRRAALDYVRGR